MADARLDLGLISVSPLRDLCVISVWQVRIPRQQMAMRFAKLEKGGKYTAGGVRGRAASYSTMTYVRATIVIDSGRALAAALTIAVRYSAVRRQAARWLQTHRQEASNRDWVPDCDS